VKPEGEINTRTSQRVQPAGGTVAPRGGKPDLIANEPISLVQGESGHVKTYLKRAACGRIQVDEQVKLLVLVLALVLVLKRVLVLGLLCTLACTLVAARQQHTPVSYSIAIYTTSHGA
jgi:hypothetical protein